MKCTYTHSELKGKYSSVEELLFHLKEIKKIRSELKAYDFNKEEAIKKNENAESFSRWYQRVTGTNNQIISESFESARGTFLHNYISKRLKDKNLINDLQEEEKKEINKIIEKFSDLKDNIWKDQTKWQTLCSTALDKIRDELKKENNVELILIEEPIYYKEDNHINIKAIPDLVYKSGDTYYIVDYKVTSSDIENNVQYIAQLLFIKGILEKHGAKKVNIANWVINPTDNGKLSIKNKNKTATSEQNINYNLHDLFSNQRTLNIDVDDEDVKKFETIKEIVEKDRSNIMQNLQTYEQYLKKRIENIKYTYYNGFIYDYVEDNGKVILKRKGSEDIEFNDFEEFAKASYEYDLNEYKATINVITDNLNEGTFMQTLDQLTNEKMKQALQLNLGKYDGSNWTVIKLGNLTEKYGIFLIKSEDTCDIIKLSNVDMFNFNMGLQSNGLFSKALNDKVRNGGVLLLDNFLPRDVINKYEQKTPDATLGNIELFELFTAISLLKNKLKDIKIGEINVISTVNGTKVHTDLQNFEQFENAFKILNGNLNETDLTSDEGLSFFSDYDKKSREEILLDNITYLLKDIGESWSPYDLDTTIIEEKKQNLRELVKSLENNSSKNIQLIQNEVIKLLTYLDNVTPNQMFEETNYGLGLQNFGVLFNALFNDNIRTVDATGQSIPGIGGGLKHTASYQTPDELIRKTNLRRDIIINNFAQRTITETAELRQATEKYLNYTKSNYFKGKFINDESIYKPLFEHTDGKIDSKMMFKNPYIIDSKNALTPEQREYLEIVLFTLNKQRGPKDFRNLTYAQLKEDSVKYEKYKDLISLHSDKYLAVPLKLKKGYRGSINRFIKAWSKSDIKNWWKDIVANIISITDPNMTTAQQLAEKRKTKKEQKEIPSLYPIREQDRIRLYQKHQPEEFILNLDLLCTDFVLDSLKRNELKSYLDTVNTVGKYLTFTEIATGMDLSHQKKALIDDTTINVYLDTLSEEEFKPIVAISNAIKKVKNVAVLGFRPGLFIKEEVLGLIKNFSHSTAKWIQNDNPITPKHMAKAYEIVVPANWYEDGLKKFLGVKSMANRSLVSLLRQRWRIHGYDLSMFSEQLSIHKTIFNYDSGLAFANVTAPDNDSRMAIVIAKMLADGTFNAYTIENNLLVYNPEKDERFSYFFANRNNDTNMQKDKKYIQQKALYEYYITSFNDSGYSIPYSKDPKDWGMIPDAYTTEQINSLKEQIGMMYGFYNHEERDQSAQGTFKRLYFEFLTWLPGELRRYFASGKNSSVGKIAHLKTIDGKLLYWKRLDDGTRIKVTDSMDEKGNALEPVYGWQAEPVVGLALCMAKVLHHGIKGDFKWFKEPNNKYFIRNAGLFLFQCLIGVIISKIIMSLIEDSKENKDKYSKEAIMAIETGSKIFNELNFINNFAMATDSLNLISINYMKDIFKDVARTINSENYNMYDFITDNFVVLRDFHLDD